MYWIKPPELSASLSLVVLFSINHGCRQSELFTIRLSLILFFTSFKSHSIILLVCSTFPPFLELKSWGEWVIFRRKVLLGKNITVIARLTTYDYWLLLRNFAPVLVWNFYGDCLTDWLTTTGFICETLNQLWCKTFTVLAWLTIYDYWLLKRNFAPVVV